MAIRESLLDALNSIATSDFVRSVTAAGASSKVTVSNLAKTIVENYTGSTLAGSSQSVKSAIDALDTSVDALDSTVDAISDYVVEQGTSGMWTYRKWNSGVSECWAHFGTTSTNSGSWTTNFPTGLFMSGTYPYVIQTPWYGESTDSSRDTRAFYITDGSSDTQFVSYFRTYNGSIYSGNIAVQAYAIGRWK